MEQAHPKTPKKSHHHTQQTQPQNPQPHIQTITKPRYTNTLSGSTNQSFNPQMSITQEQILSHGIISEVVEKSKSKTVQHHVNKISNKTRLYITPQQTDQKQFQFDTIPPRNKDFVSSASEKVGQINRRLSQSKKLADRLAEMAQKNTQKYRKDKRVQSSSVDNINKRVSISGLVTYNFNSVNARRSLGTIPDEPQQMQIAKRVMQAKKRSTNSLDRQGRIMRRKPNVVSLHRAEISNAAVCDFHTPTDKFLKIMKDESQKDEKIFGQKMQKLNCIKQYMQKQKTDYEHAKFIVEAIIKAQKKQQKIKSSRKPHQFDDDQQLAKRKQVYNRKKIMLRHLCFTEL